MTVVARSEQNADQLLGEEPRSDSSTRENSAYGAPVLLTLPDLDRLEEPDESTETDESPSTLTAKPHSDATLTDHILQLGKRWIGEEKLQKIGQAGRSLIVIGLVLGMLGAAYVLIGGGGSDTSKPPADLDWNTIKGVKKPQEPGQTPSDGLPATAPELPSWVQEQIDEGETQGPSRSGNFADRNQLNLPLAGQEQLDQPREQADPYKKGPAHTADLRNDGGPNDRASFTPLPSTSPGSDPIQRERPQADGSEQYPSSELPTYDVTPRTPWDNSKSSALPPYRPDSQEGTRAARANLRGTIEQLPVRNR